MFSLVHIILGHGNSSGSDIRNKDGIQNSISEEAESFCDARRKKSRRGRWNRNKIWKNACALNANNAKSSRTKNLLSSCTKVSASDTNNQYPQPFTQSLKSLNDLESADVTKRAVPDILSSTISDSNSNRLNIKCEIDIEEQPIEASISVTIRRYNKLINANVGEGILKRRAKSNCSRLLLYNVHTFKSSCKCISLKL